MQMFPKKHKTVQSVYDVFVEDLNSVKELQQKNADKALREQKELEDKLKAAKKLEDSARGEITMAETAIEGIRKLLGMEPTETVESAEDSQ